MLESWLGYRIGDERTADRHDELGLSEAALFDLDAELLDDFDDVGVHGKPSSQELLRQEVENAVAGFEHPVYRSSSVIGCSSRAGSTSLREESMLGSPRESSASN